jgi:hypothetical protein
MTEVTDALKQLVANIPYEAWEALPYYVQRDAIEALQNAGAVNPIGAAMFKAEFCRRA